jgi:hypothetical protein
MFGVFGPSFVNIFFPDTQFDHNTIENLRVIRKLKYVLEAVREYHLLIFLLFLAKIINDI